MIKDTCDIPEEYRSAVQVSNVSAEDAVGLAEQWGFRKDSPSYAKMVLCLQKSCDKCLAFILGKNL